MIENESLRDQNGSCKFFMFLSKERMFRNINAVPKNEQKPMSKIYITFFLFVTLNFV